ncbi:FtsW/RodA/SpoVE family cell cycle protein [Massilia consociata]|uniref:FtsW/RodA/SpoVE family cell cycle protein n=1 Tax=Massilia consociata TaxID=760117 RepID=A0ABV6FDU0_9BURK
MKARRLALPTLLAMLALGLACMLHVLALARAPQLHLPSAITLGLAPGESLVLGRAELAAPRAAARQFVVRRDASGRWFLQNLHPAQPTAIRKDEQRIRTGSAALAAGQRVQVGAAIFDIAQAGEGRVALRDSRHRWDYDGARLLRDGAPQAACPGAGAASRLSGYWNLVVPRFLALERPLAFGGHLYCGNRLPVPGLDTGSAALVSDPDLGGQIALHVRGAQPVLLREPYAPGAWLDVAQREHALDGASGLAVGRTRYALSPDGGALRLEPGAQVALFGEPRGELAPAVRWSWAERSLWGFPMPSPPAWAAMLCAALLAGGVGAGLAGPPAAGPRSGFPAPARVVAATVIIAAAALVLVMQRTGAAPGAGWALVLAWAALWHALLWARRVPALGAIAVLLLTAGLLVQLELGLGAGDTAWLRHVENSCVLLAIGLPAALLCLQGVARNQVSRPFTEALLVALALAALAGLLLQVAFGDETGVFDIQPVEFAKLALAALSAHCLALATGATAATAPGARDWRTWLRLIAPVLLFVLLLAVALIQVDDYSPLVLLLAWAAVTLLAWLLATGRRLGAGVLGMLCCAGLAGAIALQHAGPSLGTLDFYAERFQIWADPTAHPHTGQQMLRGARAIADGGWLGADGLLGIATLGQAAGEVLRIPAVQDDFAASFLLNRHGLAAGLLLWALQAALVAALLHTAIRAWRAAALAGDFRRAWLGRFQCFALCGGAAFLAGHFLLSWGTNLALFPIMGQPMSFLSSGGSHLLFFICPLLAFGVASIQSFEEIPSCRSTSNTKS